MSEKAGVGVEGSSAGIKGGEGAKAAATSGLKVMPLGTTCYDAASGSHDVLLELLSTARSSSMPRPLRPGLPSTKPSVSVSGYFDSKRSILRKVHNMET